MMPPMHHIFLTCRHSQNAAIAAIIAETNGIAASHSGQQSSPHSGNQSIVCDAIAIHNAQQMNVTQDRADR
jgi:hypothetical protein